MDQTDSIVIRGIHADGMHGIGKEREHPQSFIADVEIFGDLSDAAAANTIDATIDYAVVSREVRDVIMNDSYELIEALAEAIAARVIALGANSVRVRVSKPRAARALGVDEIAVVIQR